MKSFLIFVTFLWTAFSQCPPKLGNCFIFPPDEEWNRPIQNDPIDFRSPCILAAMETMASVSQNGPFVRLDFGTDQTPEFGIPFILEDNPVPLPIEFRGSGFGDESDCIDGTGNIIIPCEQGGLWKAPQNIPREGDETPNDPSNTGDRHTIAIDQSDCRLYETFATEFLPNGFSADSAAIFDMTKRLPQRPDDFTSADAAGLPILPGLLRFEDIQNGEINHALRFTVQSAANAYTHPASHFGGNNDFTFPYYGLRMRLKPDFPDTGYTAQGKLFIQALKKYGLIFADQGTGFFVSGTSASGWDPDFFDEINQPGNPPVNNPQKRIHITNFEIVQSPNPVVYRFAGTPSCNGLTDNNPSVFVPDFKPICQEFVAGESINLKYSLWTILAFLFVAFTQ